MSAVTAGIYGGGPIYQNGNGPPLNQAPTPESRLLFSVGSSEPATWDANQSLVSTDGTGPGSALYRIFDAFKKAVPEIDGIDFDDEGTYDPKTTVETQLAAWKSTGIPGGWIWLLDDVRGCDKSGA